MHWRRKWQPTPVFLPRESQGWGSLVAAVYGVAQSQTLLKRLSSSSSSSETQRGSVTSPQPHSTEGQSSLPHRLSSSPVSPRPSGCSGSGGVPGCVSPSPALGWLWQLPRKERRTLHASSWGLRVLPPDHPHHHQLSNKQGGKTLKTQLEFISILILEPHFQQIIKFFLITNRICVHSL